MERNRKNKVMKGFPSIKKKKTQKNKTQCFIDLLSSSNLEYSGTKF